MAFLFSCGRVLLLAAALTWPGLAAAQAQSKAPAPALAAFAARGQAQGLTAADVSDPVVTSSYADADGVVHTYLQQRVNGLAVVNATGAVHTSATGQVLFATQFFLPHAARQAPSPAPGLTAAQAVVAAAVALGLPRPVGLRPVVEARAADGLLFNKAGISEENIAVRLLYERVGEELVLVWGVTIAPLDQQHYWQARVNAQTGRLVSQDDYTVREAATFQQHAAAAWQRQQQALAFARAAHSQPAGPPLRPLGSPRSLTVVAVPGENPLASPRVSVPLSAANRAYSPYGWQVGEGLAPSGFFADDYSLLLSSGGKQLTRGNNVVAYDDNATTVSGNGNASSPTNSPDGGSALDFDFPFDQSRGPREAGNLAAAITNLFYWNNINHDVQMAHGFTEAAGNFQYRNLTGQGLGNDFVRAEAQDGGGRNNANFSAPPDGVPGRMQMYLFDNVPASFLTVSSPSAAAGAYNISGATFGRNIFTALPGGVLCGTLVVVNDGVSADGGAHSCAAPYVNAAAVKGNIALLMRGGCTTSNTYTDKVKLAQSQGAIAVVVFDGAATTAAPLEPGGTDATVTIPVLGISGAAGNQLKAALAGGQTAAVCIQPSPNDFDGSFDSGVMSHEFGHGVSIRLTGGPANSGCLNNTTGNQTMGEGWSDFFGLWLTTHPGDLGSTPRYVATYDKGQPLATGPGLRSRPYTTDLTQNEYTYAKLGTGPGQFSETHAVGEVWCAVLWDLNWQFIYKYGYNPDFYAAEGGNNKLLKLVLDGCKYQVCNPGFLDGRDALLRADSATSGAANADLIWAVFARRGMGYSAVQGPRTGAGNAPVVDGSRQAFDVPPTAHPLTLSAAHGVVTSSALEAFPNPAQDHLTVRTQAGSTAPMEVALYDLLGQAVLPPTTVPVAQMQQGGATLPTAALPTGLYVVRVRTTSGVYTTRVTVQH